jgi:hypothetical protein
MTNESFPDQLKPQESESAKDFDTLPARLLSLLFHTLDIKRDKDLVILNVRD